MQDSPKEEKESKDPKIRILEVDRKLAAQLYDVWQDMKHRIQRETSSSSSGSALRTEVSQGVQHE